MSVSKGGKKRNPRPSTVTRTTYKGRHIVLRRGAEFTELEIDGQNIPVGRDAAGLYYLDRFAYARNASLLRVAKNYIDHLVRAGGRKRHGR